MPPDDAKKYRERSRNIARTRLLTAGLALLLGVLFILSLLIGRMETDLAQILSVAGQILTGREPAGKLPAEILVFWWIRLPRCIMAVTVGMALSVSGAVYQGLFRNPLVSPDILGVAAGCTFGAALGLVLPGHSFALVHLLAFVFGLLAVYIALGIARLVAVKPVIVLVLAGLVVLSVFNALLMVLKYFSDPYDELPAIVFWIMGSLTRVTWQDGVPWAEGRIPSAPCVRGAMAGRQAAKANIGGMT